MTDRAPRPEGMSDAKLAEIRANVLNEDADRCTFWVDANDLLIEVDRLRAVLGPHIGGDGIPQAICLLCGHIRELAVFTWIAQKVVGVCGECRANANDASRLRADVGAYMSENRFAILHDLIDAGSELMHHENRELVDEVVRTRAAIRELRLQVEETIWLAVTDVDVDGFITAYHFKTGAIHRLLAKVRS